MATERERERERRETDRERVRGIKMIKMGPMRERDRDRYTVGPLMTLRVFITGRGVHSLFSPFPSTPSH